MASFHHIAVRASRITLSVVYLILIILSLPMAFDVGGINCGLTFSFTIFSLYFVLTSISLISSRSRWFYWISTLYYLQYVIIPSLLTLFLSYYSGKSKPANFYVVELWKLFIVNSTPLFTILEGFCSLLSIQAIGQTINWLTIYKSDSWLIVSLVASGSTITGAFYFLYRIYVLPITIDAIEASLLGSLLTLTIGLSLFGILSGKGSIIESSLLFAYIVRCIYETFPQLSENASQALSMIFVNTNLSAVEIPVLPPQLANTLLTVVPFLAANLPGSIKTMYDFLKISVKTLPIPVLFNFSYRIAVFFAATKIIPALYHSTLYPSTNSPPRTPPLEKSSSISLSRSNSNSSNISHISSNSSRSSSSTTEFHLSSKQPSTVVRLIYSFSPCIIIPVYTHLLMLYNQELASHLKVWNMFTLDVSYEFGVHPLQFWNWINMATTLVLYLMELFSNDNSVKSNLTNHWNIN